MTAGRYPRPLEEILNARSPGPEFSVIDEGRGATNSSYVLSRLEENLDRYRPDFVAAMIGNNDRGVAYLDGAPYRENFLFRRSRAFRFLSLAWMGAARRRQEAALRELPLPDPPGRPAARRPDLPQWLNHLRQGRRLLHGGRARAAEALLREAARLAPREARTALALEELESLRGHPEQARRFLALARSLPCADADSLTAWGHHHLRRRQWALAQAAFARAVAVDYGALGALQGLSQALVRQGEVGRAEELLLGLTTRHPDQAEIWAAL
ncbi:MAG: hypothetical protein PHU21_05070, partial [Elusimicrobia bacterium]|nr:hypothetical protein [Elusimicrobiota bacterium]